MTFVIEAYLLNGLSEREAICSEAVTGVEL